MNRYIIQGVLDDLAAGRSVHVVAPALIEADHAHSMLLAAAKQATEAEGSCYSWSLTNGRKWLKDELTNATATFSTVRAVHADAADADVVLILRYRRMVRPGIAEKDDQHLMRLQKLSEGRDAVVVD